MPNPNRSRPGALIAVAFTGVLLGAVLGALTNSIHGWVSPTDFRNIMRWHSRSGDGT
jgi:ABC-type Fe3+-siderophore transport system permease subunit